MGFVTYFDAAANQSDDDQPGALSSESCETGWPGRVVATHHQERDERE